MSNPQIRTFNDPQEVASAAGDQFTRLAREAIAANGRFTVALAGGSTPKALYTMLGERAQHNMPPRLAWDKIHLFFGDERHVPPDHADSNFRMASESLISKIRIPAGNVHRVKTENPDAAAAAADYDHQLIETFGLTGSALPRFDLILLGMGPDGHTASLFPGTEAVKVLNQRVVANWVPKFNTWRVTFTRPVLNNAATVMLLVCGPDKADPLSQVMGTGSPDTYPVKYVQPTDGQLIWLLDKAAAAKLASQASAT
jgi:6-phosphogluconolactonase